MYIYKKIKHTPPPSPLEIFKARLEEPSVNWSDLTADPALSRGFDKMILRLLLTKIFLQFIYKYHPA